MTRDNIEAKRVMLVSAHDADWHAGASTVYLHLDAELRDLGHDVRLVHQADYAGGGGPTVRKIAAAKRLATWLKPHAARCDVIEVAGNLGWAAFEGIGHRRGSLRVTRLHGLEFKDEQARVDEAIAGVLRLPRKYLLFGRRLANWQERRTIAAADVVICHSSREVDAIVAAGWKRAGDIELMPLGVDARFFGPRPNAGPGHRVIWWGSWVDRKGISSVPRAFQLACEARPGLTLTIGGAGTPPDVILRDFAPDLRPRITVLPFVAPAEHVQALRDHDIFLFPSLSEGFGLSLLEAMATGLPAVTTFTGMAHDWLEHGRNCLLTPMSAPTALARAIVRLANDRELRQALGIAAAQTAGELSWGRFGQRTADLYAERLARLHHGAAAGS